MFGTSRGPIREACKGLVQAGLLTAVPNSVICLQMDVRQALEVYDIRAFLDQLIGQLAATHGTNSRLGAMGYTRLIRRFGRMTLKLLSRELSFP